MSEPLPILVLVSDMIFASKISAEARAQGSAFKMLNRPEKLAGQIGRALIVDLNLPGATAAAAEWAKASGRPVTGFVSHVDAAAIAEARELGIENILARSRFVQVLGQLVKPEAVG
jgi:hypothetical protein